MNDNLRKDLLEIKKDFNAPENIHNSVNETLLSLSYEKNSNHHKIISIKTLIAVAIITTLTISTVFAEDLAQGIMSFFKGKPSTTLGNKDAIQSVNSVVNITDTQNEGSLTLNDFSIDDNFLVCSYTLSLNSSDLKNDDTIKKFGFTPIIYYNVDGKDIYYQCDSEETDYYFESDNTIKFMQRIGLTSYDISDKGNINISLELPNYDYSNTWSLKTKYNKTSASSLTKTIDINKNITLKNNVLNMKENTTENFTNNFTIEKVSFSPLGNIITIKNTDSSNKEKVGACNFLLIDNKGNYLNTVNEYEISNESTITYEFLAENTDISSIKIVPINDIYHAPATLTELYDLNNVPSSIKLGDSSTLQIDNIATKNNEISIEFHFDDYSGTTLNQLPCFFYDENNNPIEAGGYLRNIVDRNTNSFTCTYGFYTQEDFDKVSKISFDINNRYKVNYDNAVTVDLK